MHNATWRAGGGCAIGSLDLKSCVRLRTCGFESRLGYLIETACFSTGNMPFARAFPVDSREFPRSPSPASWWQFAAICGEPDVERRSRRHQERHEKSWVSAPLAAPRRCGSATSLPADLLMTYPDVKRRFPSRQSAASQGPTVCGLCRSNTEEKANGVAHNCRKSRPSESKVLPRIRSGEWLEIGMQILKAGLLGVASDIEDDAFRCHRDRT